MDIRILVIHLNYDVNMDMYQTTKEELIYNPWVQCPHIKEVDNLISNFTTKNFYRGSGYARSRLDLLELRYRDWISEITNLDSFSYCYFVNGVTDAINQWCLQETREWQYFIGDYEYPKSITGKGLRVSKPKKDTLLYVSNPFCATGDFINIENLECPVILDCAYVGATRKYKIGLPKNTEQVWFSFSKGWGLIGQRLGLVFSKYKIPSLELMKKVECWNFNGVELCHLILDNFATDTVYNMYRKKQEQICRDWNFDPSDCFFIAKTTDTEYRKRQRIKGLARIDLSKIFNEELS